ncbi:hypothetical protein GPALN_002236 [Globodera pallida]|nr:hypothetical protein GPALN_002236 [Globodera pallida]
MRNKLGRIANETHRHPRVHESASFPVANNGSIRYWEGQMQLRQQVTDENHHNTVAFSVGVAFFSGVAFSAWCRIFRCHIFWCRISGRQFFIQIPHEHFFGMQ